MKSTITQNGRGAGTVQSKAPLRTVKRMEQEFGPRTAEVEAVLEALRGFTAEQWKLMAAARIAASADAWDAARDAARDAGVVMRAAWDASWDAAELAARIASWDAGHAVLDDAARDAPGAAPGAEVVADLISPEHYGTLTGPFRLACDMPPWHTDADIWAYFLELVPALGIDGARQAVELTALPRA